jgi:F-type H+-transporting ATPase subunit a
MVLIELTRNIIRPLTLCIRLIANIIAGHLLMSLLNSILLRNFFIRRVILSLVSLTLTFLELAVACIQAYVFTVLIALYIAEIK